MLRSLGGSSQNQSYSLWFDTHTHYIDSNPINLSSYTSMLRSLGGSSHNQSYSLWFDTHTHYIDSNSINLCSYTLLLRRSSQNQSFSLWFDPSSVTHDWSRSDILSTHYPCANSYETVISGLFRNWSVFVLLTVSCPIFPSILIVKNLLTGSLKNRSIDNLETQKKSISMKNSQFFDYLLYAKSK